MLLRLVRSRFVVDGVEELGLSRTTRIQMTKRLFLAGTVVGDDLRTVVTRRLVRVVMG